MWKWVEVCMALSIGVHDTEHSDNHTEYFELMSHITGAVVQTPLTLNKNTLIMDFE
jgi:hypothetical protein